VDSQTIFTADCYKFIFNTAKILYVTYTTLWKFDDDDVMKIIKSRNLFWEDQHLKCEVWEGFKSLRCHFLMISHLIFGFYLHFYYESQGRIQTFLGGFGIFFSKNPNKLKKISKEVGVWVPLVTLLMTVVKRENIYRISLILYEIFKKILPNRKWKCLEWNSKLILNKLWNSQPENHVALFNRYTI